MFGKMGMVFCTSCKFRDTKNSFKENQVTIKASITEGDTVSEVSEFFTVDCAKCAKCNKILFTRMSKFKKLKKEASKYFEDRYPLAEIKLTNINM